jgi:spermidine synthase
MVMDYGIGIKKQRMICRKMEKMRHRDLLAVVFISGACAMLVEIAGARIIAPYLGSTIFTWTAVIGLVLASLSIGYYIGGSFADRYNDRKHLSTILLGAGIATIILPMLGNSIIPFTVFIDLIPASLMASLVLVPASLCYGMVSPYVIKLTSSEGKEGVSAGRIFALSTAGSIAGVLGTGFLLIPNMALTHIFILAGAAMILMSWVALRKRSAMIDMVPLVLLALISSQFGFIPMLKGEVLHEEESQYYNIRVMETEINNGPARLMMLDNAYSSAERADGQPAFDYVNKTRLGYELVENPENALVLGVAAGTEVEELKANFPEVQVYGVDIDARGMELGMEYFSLEDDERTTLVTDDARRFLKRTDKEFDIVLLDVFRGFGLPPHLSTKEFFTELKERMSNDGVVIANVISSVEGEESEALLLLHSTFSSVFDNVIMLPVRSDPQKVQNIVIIATDRGISAFEQEHATDIYREEIEKREPLSDELNPIELYAAR